MCLCKVCGAVSMVQVNRMLKPDKWQAAFDSDGKAFGFQKALKSIVLGVCCLTMKDDEILS